MVIEADRRDYWPVPSWAEVVLAFNDDVIACERRISLLSAHLVVVTAEGQDTADDEMLLKAYLTALTLARNCRDQLLDQVGTIP